MIPFPNAAVVILRPRMIDDMGAQVPDWGDPERVELGGACHVQAGATVEDNTRAGGVETEMTLWAPITPRIRPDDRVEVTYTAPEVQGEVVGGLRVNGRPRVMIDPVDPADSYQRATLQRMEG